MAPSKIGALGLHTPLPPVATPLPHSLKKGNYKNKDDELIQYSLKALLNQKTNSSIARSIQDSLYNTHNIRLGWIRDHVMHLGNQKAHELAKEANTST
ncbi:hypothetical protein AVEN_3134-1 [Araneus ventricosus]|uniref:RNase H type-1 domain-containing protein n=1 Tax=Araneus ventricosus TaxID=182803 RepID=A0A4Y2QVN0_ARAVE|nr:hypothetical protein AVEN_3134-1 [Araneus ventricosus]